MKFVTQVLLAVFTSAVLLNTAEAKRNNPQQVRDSNASQQTPSYQDRNSDSQKNNQTSSQAVDEKSSDSDIIRAMSDQRRVNFVEGGSMVVTKLLPDDTNGLEHQKWVVKLTNGKTMQAVYNLDMCPRVQLKVGDTIAMAGQFVWTNSGGLLHWLHKDPRGNRPDGYVYVNGRYYCKD